MPERVTTEFKWTSGFVPSQTKTGGFPGSIIDGSNVYIWGAGLLESSKGFASAGSSGGANPLMNVGGTHGGCTGGGTVTAAFGTYFVTGSGTALVGGSSLGSASSTLKMYSGGSLVTVGLNQPSAPTIADSGVSGKNDGSYSICLTALDTLTGQESTRSLPSNVVSVTGKKIRITLPSTVATNQNKWGIYCSFRNFGATGPWFHLSDTSTLSGTVDVEWYNGELGDEAPIDYNPPPTGTHCFAVNNVMVQAGCYGGSGLAPSIPGKPGAYPPDFTVFLPNGGAITGCKSSGIAGAILISTASSLSAVIATNSPITPIAVRQIWPTTGFATGSAWCVIEDEIYGFTGQRGAVRTQGDAAPDTTFALPVHKYFADNSFSASNTTVVYDPKVDTVWFCSGTRALGFYRTGGWWHTPMTLGGSAVTSVTVGGQALIDIGGGSLTASEGGSGTTWYSTFAFSDGGFAEFNKTVVRLRAASNATCQADILTNLDLSTSASGAISITASHSAWSKQNIRDAKTFSVKLSGSGQQQSVYEVVCQFVPHRVTS